MRSGGILLHITSLPSKYGIGTLGKEAFRFVDFLEQSGIKYWQVLPLGPTTIGDSPYQSFSAFAGNPLLIDLNLLIEDGLITEDEIEKQLGNYSEDKVDYNLQFHKKYPLLHSAGERFFENSNLADYFEFLREQKDWLDDYCLFMAIKYHKDQLPWNHWEGDIKFRKHEAIQKYEELLYDEIRFWRFLQYMFTRQWRRLKAYANEKGILIIGDIPIYVSYDSADVWVNPSIFDLDVELEMENVAGCPPDDTFSKTGQLWGNPIYNWKVLRERGYDWWIKRIQYSLSLYDKLRIDHFRGFDSYYAVPARSLTAENGRWMEGPGKDFFIVLKQELGELPIIAENLGFETESVIELLACSGFPGMNVLEYGFHGERESKHMPHNYKKYSITYLGTHDNDTCLGYLDSLDEETFKFVKKYINVSEVEECVWGMIRAAYVSVSDLVIIQMQDYLELDSDSRMNFPSQLSDNWVWRMKTSDINSELSAKIKELGRIYFRNSKEK